MSNSPSDKQKIAFDKVMNEGKNVKTAMLEAGYKPSFAENPQELTNSEGWKILLEKYVPDDLLAQKHHELLEARDKEGFTDYNAMKSGLDMGYKLKGKYAPEKKVEITIDIESNEEIQKLADKLNELDNEIHKGTDKSSDGTDSSVMDKEV